MATYTEAQGKDPLRDNSENHNENVFTVINNKLYNAEGKHCAYTGSVHVSNMNVDSSADFKEPALENVARTDMLTEILNLSDIIFTSPQDTVVKKELSKHASSFPHIVLDMADSKSAEAASTSQLALYCSLKSISMYLDIVENARKEFETKESEKRLNDEFEKNKARVEQSEFYKTLIKANIPSAVSYMSEKERKVLLNTLYESCACAEIPSERDIGKLEGMYKLLESLSVYSHRKQLAKESGILYSVEFSADKNQSLKFSSSAFDNVKNRDNIELIGHCAMTGKQSCIGIVKNVMYKFVNDREFGRVSKVTADIQITDPSLIGTISHESFFFLQCMVDMNPRTNQGTSIGVVTNVVNFSVCYRKKERGE